MAARQNGNAGAMIAPAFFIFNYYKVNGMRCTPARSVLRACMA